MPAKSDPPDIVKTATELIARLGISRSAFYDYKKQGAPKRLSVKTWKNWIAKRKLGTPPKPPRGTSSATSNAAQADVLTPEANELAELKLRAARAEAETKEATALLTRWKADAATGSQINREVALQWLTQALEPLAKWIETLALEYGEDYPATPEGFFVFLEELGFEGAELARQSLKDAAERINGQ